jgi:hypothetical protein
MNSINIRGFQQVVNEKKVSELYLGTLDINWKFLKVGYNAICTEALPLTFFEKMVCGIANLDEKVYLNDLAHIMGLNIEEDILNLKFQDKAETEILMETLRSLNEYGMISKPDDSFSYIELTPLGKEYYVQGRKFKQGQNKGFTMYFDLMADDNEHARELFGKLSVDGSIFDEELSIPYADEAYVKQFAERQIPQYYSKTTGNSFTDMSVSSTEVLYKKIVVCIIYDSFIEKFRLDIVDDGGLDRSYLADYLNRENITKKYLDEFASQHISTIAQKPTSQTEFEEEITRVQRDAEYEIFNKNPQNAVKIVSDFAHSPKYMEVENVFNFINIRIKNKDIKSVFIHIPTISPEEVEIINSISENDNIKIYLTSGNVNDCDSSFSDRIFVLRDEQKLSPILMLDDVLYESQDLVFMNGEGCLSVEFLHRQDTDLEQKWSDITSKFAKHYLPIEIKEISDILYDESDCDVFERINNLNSLENHIRFDSTYIISTGYSEQVDSIYKSRNEKLINIISDYTRNLIEEVEKLKEETLIDSIDTIEKMTQVKDRLDTIKKKIIPERLLPLSKEIREEGIMLALDNTIHSFETRLDERDVFLRQELLPKSYIIDTNIFVLFPKVMDFISKEDRIILSGKVLDELDKLKGTTVGADKKNVLQAIREINYMLKMLRENVILEAADTRLLPEDFDKKNSDNIILSVALKYRDRNPFMVTNDTNFQNRAAFLNIPSKGLKDILPDDVYNSIEFNKPTKKAFTSQSPLPPKMEPGSEMHPRLYKLIVNAYESCRRVGEDVLVSLLVGQIKLIDPRFKTKYYGFEKFKDLCNAYPSVIELYNNETNALCIRLKKKDMRTGYAKEKSKNQLDYARLILLKQLVEKMISEEDPSAPIQDGDIRVEFEKITKIPIKLNIVRQTREELGIPTTKIRKENFKNKN